MNKDEFIVWFQRLLLLVVTIAFMYITGWKGILGFVIGVAVTAHLMITNDWLLNYFIDLIGGKDD